MREAGSRHGPLVRRARNTGRSSYGLATRAARHTGSRDATVREEPPVMRARDMGSRYGPLMTRARDTSRSRYGLAIRGGILRGPAPLLSPVFPPSVTHPAVGVPPHCHTPTKVARNLIRSLFEIARKRCNSNDAISYL